uniref:Adipocyte plasma membrane-associated protein n=1 Tax=Steinernema glaseri TaxID=37863 RepID=A0A1I8AFG4_9BILA
MNSFIDKMSPPCLPRGTGYRDLTETESTKELDLSNHLTEVRKKASKGDNGHVNHRRTRSKGLLKEKNFWIFLVSMFVFLAMFVCLRVLANLDPVRVRELQFLRTRYVHEPKTEFPLLDFPEIKNYWPGIVKITDHVIANLTTPGKLSFSIFSPTEKDKTINVNAKRLVAYNSSENGNYGRAVVEIDDGIFYLYYFTPNEYLNNLIHVDNAQKGYERSTFFVPTSGHVVEAAFIGDDVFIREYTREFTRRFTPFGQDYIEARSTKLRRLNKLLRKYDEVTLIARDQDYYFLCRGTMKSPSDWLLLNALDGIKIRGMYMDTLLSEAHKLSLHFTDSLVMVVEENMDGERMMDYTMNLIDMKDSLQVSIYAT